jgi:hypothetical protein
MVVPDKSKGSVDLGHAQISHAQMESRFFVASECENLIQSFNHYTDSGSAKDEGFKHALDAARYGVDDTFEQPTNQFQAPNTNAIRSAFRMR